MIAPTTARICGNFAISSDLALDAAQRRVMDAKQRVHLTRCVFILPARVMYQNISSWRPRRRRRASARPAQTPRSARRSSRAHTSRDQHRSAQSALPSGACRTVHTTRSRASLSSALRRGVHRLPRPSEAGVWFLFPLHLVFLRRSARSGDQSSFCETLRSSSSSRAQMGVCGRCCAMRVHSISKRSMTYHSFHLDYAHTLPSAPPYFQSDFSPLRVDFSGAAVFSRVFCGNKD